MLPIISKIHQKILDKISKKNHGVEGIGRRCGTNHKPFDEFAPERIDERGDGEVDFVPSQHVDGQRDAKADGKIVEEAKGVIVVGIAENGHGIVFNR